jgi:hypothetical protein
MSLDLVPVDRVHVAVAINRTGQLADRAVKMNLEQTVADPARVARGDLIRAQ